MKERRAYWEKIVADASARHGRQITLRPKSESRFLWPVLQFLFSLFTYWIPIAFTFGWAKSRLQKVDIINGFHSMFSSTMWLAGDGSSWEESSTESKDATASHEIDHLDRLYFGNGSIREEWDALEKKPKPSRLRWAWNAFRYLFWLLPFKYATYRQEFERDGYARSLQVVVHVHGGKVPDYWRQWLIVWFSGPGYGWMATPERAEEVVKGLIEEVERVHSLGENPYARFQQQQPRD